MLKVVNVMLRNVEKLLTKVKVWSVGVNHYQTLNELKVEKHPEKTFIGRIAKGFDFLGYSFEPKGLSIAPKTLANFLYLSQLYPHQERAVSPDTLYLSS